MAIVIPNTTTADGDVPAIPLRPEGTPYRFEMGFDAFRSRAYADDTSDLLGCLIPGYAELNDDQRLHARLDHAVRTQVTFQAVINHAHSSTAATPEEWAVLEATRAVPPAITEWGCEIPLVVVDLFYEPFTETPAPVSTIADVDEPPNLYWLKPSDEVAYLVSLAAAGFISLNEHQAYRH